MLKQIQLCSTFRAKSLTPNSWQLSTKKSLNELELLQMAVMLSSLPQKEIEVWSTYLTIHNSSRPSRMLELTSVSCQSTTLEMPCSEFSTPLPSHSYSSVVFSSLTDPETMQLEDRAVWIQTILSPWENQRLESK